jgi:MFS transporter, DHA1 family, putative efflux transporter
MDKGGEGIQVITLALLSIFFGSLIVISMLLYLLLIIAEWTFVLPQNFNFVSLVPDASGIILSLDNSFV